MFGNIYHAYEHDTTKVTGTDWNAAHLDANSVTYYGAVGDGTTDDTTAIKAAITAVEAMPRSSRAHPTLYFPPASGDGYLVTEPIAVGQNVNVIMDSPILYDRDEDDAVAVLTIGATGANQSFRVRHKLSVVNIGTSGSWSVGEFGILLLNHYECDIRIDEVSNFRAGLTCRGDATGFAYNTVSLGRLYNCLRGVTLDATTAGWCNENLFLGGRFGIQSGLNEGTIRYGVVIWSSDDTYTINNNNVFIKPSFELLSDGYPINIQAGVYNQFYYCRNEGNSANLLTVGGTATRDNVVHVGYPSSAGTWAINDDSTVKRNSVQQVYGDGYYSGTAAPSTGTWLRGQRVWNKEPSAEGYVGWVCTSGGSPGTWKGFGAIQA